MILYFNNTQLEIDVDDNSYCYQQIMGEHSLTLAFSLSTYVEIPVGAYCDFQGERYLLTKPQNFKKQHSRSGEYTIILDSSQAQLTKYKFKDPGTKKLKFCLTAKPQEHLKMLVDNLNQRDSGWSVGDYVDASEKLITYSHNYCNEVLTMIAEAYNTEWEIVGKTIHLRRVEYNKDNPLPLSYGEGKGFKAGLGRTNFDSSKAIEILYVQGGEKNIDPSVYGSTELLLPKNQILVYGGRTYITDSEGLSIRRAYKALQTNEEDSLDCSHIYPQRTGTASEVVIVDATKNFYDFIDTSLTFDFNNYLITGETMTVIFQSGMLAGRELDVKYIHAAIGTKQGKRFELVPQEIDGQTMPNEIFKPVVGDKYIVFGMQMPDEYVCDNVNQIGASWDMFKEGAKYLFENEDPRFSFTGELDGIYAKQNWVNIGGRIVLGGFVLFSDEQFQITGVPIRIMGIKQLINNPYKPLIELSNVTAGGSVSSTLRKAETNEAYTNAVNKETIGFTKRRYRDAKETIELLKQAQLHFSDSINPITVETMSLLVGDVSLQFRFVAAKLSQTVINHNITWDSEGKTLSVDGAWLQHMTLGIGSITKSHTPEEYKYWQLAHFDSPVLEDQMVEGEMKSLAYYLYAHCIGNGITQNAASFILTPDSHQSVEGDYYFLVGILNSEFENDRSFVSLYGYTEILPGRITADRIVSTDGLNFMDFVKKAFRVGSAENYLEYNRDVWNAVQGAYVGDGKLRLKGMLVQNAGGIEDVIGVFRGDYSSSETYYIGDEAYYLGSTYRYIYPSPSSTIPTNASYWKVKAIKGVKGEPGVDGNNGLNGMDGSDGKDGTDYEYIFKLSTTNSAPATPASIQADDYVPTGWSDDPMLISATNQYEWVCQRYKTDGVWSAFSAPVLWARYSLDGNNGSNGSNGANGDYTEFQYAKNSSPEVAPAITVTSLNPAGWSTVMPTAGASEYVWVTFARKNAAGTALVTNWNAPSRSTGLAGAAGLIGPTPIYRGVYDPSKTYYGTTARVDIVKYNGAYYVARSDAGSDAGSFSGILPTNAAKWNAFGAQFDSVATDLLFANLAYIDNLGVRYLRTATSGQRIEINGDTGTLNFYNASNQLVMSLANGIMTALGAVLQNVLLTSGSVSANSAIKIDGGEIVVSETSTGEFSLTFKSMNIGAAGIDLYQILGRAAKHVIIHNLNATLSMDGTEITVTDTTTGLVTARMNLNGAWGKAVTAESMATKYITLPVLTSAEISAVPRYSIYVDPNGRHAAKDGNGTPHTLW